MEKKWRSKEGRKMVAREKSGKNSNDNKGYKHMIWGNIVG